jgi:hypothetical protein
MVELKRNCPKCNKEIFYSSKGNLKRAERNSVLCSSCCLIGNHYSKGKSPPNKGNRKAEIQKSLDLGLIWKENNLWFRKCPTCNNPTKCSSYDNAYRRLRECCHKCGNRKNIGSERSTDTKNKQRISAIKRLQKHQLFNKPNFNPKACEFINKLNSSMGFNLKHALNGGEVWLNGFYPDGYDKEKNIIFEYDESHHSNPKLKEKDVDRQEKLINEVRPSKFIRYNEKDNRLYDALTEKDIYLSI